MDLYYKQEVSVGLLVIVAIIGFFGGLMWLTGRSFRASQIEFPVQFTEVANLNVGDPVQISGVNVGRVSKRELQEEGRVIITLEVSRRFPPAVDARVSIKALDFLGAKVVAYSPGTSSTPLGEDQVIIGSSSSDIAERVDDLSEEAVEVLIGMQRLFTAQIAEDVHNTLQATEHALEVIARAGEGPLIGQTHDAFRALEQVALRLDTTLANPAINESLSQLDELTENVTEMTQGLAGATMALQAMLQQMNDTTGSVGMLLNNKTIHDDLHALLVSMTKLLDDVRERPSRYTNISLF
ncbi:MAG: MCE family protein [Gemmatimonadota bacterium]|nr:MAG: MCE family protein [Gemmatimonadota bacterium]